MKRFDCTAGRWRRAAAAVGWVALIVFAIGATALVLASIQSFRRGSFSASFVTVSSSSAITAPSSRPALLQQIADRPIHQRLLPPPTVAAAKPSTVPTVTVLPPPPAPELELVATFRSDSGQRCAYLRKPGKGDLLTWTSGARADGFTVTDIGDGYIVLENSEARHTLHVKRRGM